MKKIKRLVLGMAIMVVAGVNVYVANTTHIKLSELQLENIEMIATASENVQDCGYSALFYESEGPGLVNFRSCGPSCPKVKGKNAKFDYCAWVSFEGFEG